MGEVKKQNNPPTLTEGDVCSGVDNYAPFCDIQVKADQSLTSLTPPPFLLILFPAGSGRVMPGVGVIKVGMWMSEN